MWIRHVIWQRAYAEAGCEITERPGQRCAAGKDFQHGSSPQQVNSVFSTGLLISYHLHEGAGDCLGPPEIAGQIHSVPLYTPSLIIWPDRVCAFGPLMCWRVVPGHLRVQSPVRFLRHRLPVQLKIMSPLEVWWLWWRCCSWRCSGQENKDGGWLCASHNASDG